MKVSVSRSGNDVSLSSNYGNVDIKLDPKVEEVSELNDFAAWVYLPVAMSKNEDLYIQGKGTSSTVKNAHKLSNLWAMWMPAHYSTVNIKFEEKIENSKKIADRSSDSKLILYSGGIDSTYSAHKNFSENKLDLLTLKRGDYEIVEKRGKEFTKRFANRRLIAETNVRYLYENNNIRKKEDSLTTSLMTFDYAGVLFLHSSYDDYYIASDFAKRQLPSVYPYINHPMSNSLFDNGNKAIKTTDLQKTRSEKVDYIYNQDLSQYVNFCSSDEFRNSNNCGKCSKCIRTKLMYKVTNNDIPNIFMDSELQKNWVNTINFKKRFERVFINEILVLATQSDKVEVPKIDEAKKELESAWLKQHPSESPHHKLLLKAYNNVPYPLNSVSRKIYNWIFS